MGSDGGWGVTEVLCCVVGSVRKFPGRVGVGGEYNRCGGE